MAKMLSGKNGFGYNSSEYTVFPLLMVFVLFLRVHSSVPFPLGHFVSGNVRSSTHTTVLCFSNNTWQFT